jgi:hypothetical protein
MSDHFMADDPGRDTARVADGRQFQVGSADGAQMNFYDYIFIRGYWLRAVFQPDLPRTVVDCS